MNRYKKSSERYHCIVRIIAVAAILIFLLIPVTSHSDGWELKPLRVAIGLSQPPYIIKSEQKGLEYEIVEETLKKAGYKMYPKFVDFGEEPGLIRDNKVDAAMTMKFDSSINSYFSDEYIIYHNYAITLESSGLKIDNVDDLTGMSVLAFQDAGLYLGPEFKKIIKGNPEYSETPLQYRQNLDLYMGRVNVVIADKNIFRWYDNDVLVAEIVDTDKKVSYHNIFKPTHYTMAFREEKARDDFNKALADMKSSGRYKEIQDKYNIGK